MRGAGDVVVSPACRAHVDGATVDPRVGPWDLGRWTGRALADLPQEQLAAWRSDPSWAGHGGESLEQLHGRVAAVLHTWHDGPPRRVVVTHGGVVRAAVVTALRAPADAVWDLDVRPGSRTELSATAEGWRVQAVGCS
ncbi:MAG TPA: histidine phosphatase family protein [Mycobacteriales bacterium]|nr:histidine phosphatase family protein [Mycobacteriales bacterium]